MEILFLCTDIVIDPEALELCNSALSFSTGIKRTPGDDSWPNFWVKKTSIWARNWGPHKNIGICASISRAPLRRPLPGLFSYSCQSARNWFVMYITLEIVGGTMTKTKWINIKLFLFYFYALTLYFSDGPDNLCEPTSADSKSPESVIWFTRQCLPVVGSLLLCIPQLVWVQSLQSTPLFIMEDLPWRTSSL